jgi:hypothetical protein
MFFHDKGDTLAKRRNNSNMKNSIALIALALAFFAVPASGLSLEAHETSTPTSLSAAMMPQATMADVPVQAGKPGISVPGKRLALHDTGIKGQATTTGPDTQTQSPPEPQEQTVQELSGSRASFIDQNLEVDDQVLMDQKGVRIELKNAFVEVYDGWFQISIRTTNHSKHTINIDALDASVNGYMVNTNIDSYRICFSLADLQRAGVSAIREFEMVLVASDYKTNKVITRSDVITVRTHAYDTEQEAPNDSGTVALDAGGVKVVAKGIGKAVTMEGLDWTVLNVYIENNSRQPLTFLTNRILVNGVKVRGALAATVCVGKKAYAQILVSQEDLDEAAIVNVKTVTFSLRAYNRKRLLFGKRLATHTVTVHASN